MEWFKKNWSFIVILIVAILWFRECNQDPEIVEVPIEVKVEVPVIEKQFDTIKLPTPVPVTKKVIDSTLYKEHVKLKDSIAKDSAYKEAIAINEYNQVFDDSIQTIEVYTKTQGKILEQSLQYETKPRTITFLDTLEIKKKGSLNVGGGVGLTPPIVTGKH